MIYIQGMIVINGETLLFSGKNSEKFIFVKFKRDYCLFLLTKTFF